MEPPSTARSEQEPQIQGRVLTVHVIHPGWRVTELRRKAIVIRRSGQKIELEPG